MKTLCLALIGFTLNFVSPTSALTFTGSTVSSGENEGALCTAATDLAGQQHIVWTRVTSGNRVTLHFATRIAGETQLGGGEVPLSSGSPPRAIDLLVDRLGALHLFVLRENGALLHVGRSASVAGSWLARTVDSSGGIGADASCSAELGANGTTLSVAYTGAGGTLKYATASSGNGSWQITTINSTPGVGFAPSLALGGPRERPISVSHYDSNSEDLLVTEAITVPRPDWRTEVVSRETDSGRSNAIARLADGGLGIAFQTVSEGASTPRRSYLNYAHRRTSGSSWTVERVDSSENYPAPSSAATFTLAEKIALAPDAAGNPQIAYANQTVVIFLVPLTTDDVRFTRQVPGYGWQRTLIETTEGSNVLTGLDLTTDGAGDPTVVYESDPGAGDSRLRAAKPVSRPYVTRALPIADGATFNGNPISAPALAPSPGGGVLAVTTILSGSGSLLRLHVPVPGGGTTVQVLGASIDQGVFHANVAATGGDGTTHILSVFLGAPDSTSGQLHHTHVRHGRYIGRTQLGRCTPDPPAIFAGDDGTLHLVRGNAETGKLEYLAVRASGVSQENFSPKGQGLSIAVRGDDGRAITYIDRLAREVRMLTNVGSNGGLLKFFEDHLLYTVLSGETLPKNTSVTFAADGLPRVLFGLRSTLRLARPSLGGMRFDTVEVATGVLNGWVNLQPRPCGNYVALFSSTLAGGSVGLREFTGAGRLVRSETLLEHGSTPFSFGTRTGAQAPEIAALLDSFGFPVVAAAVATTPQAPGLSQVLLTRAADGLDTDLDGLPLVVENAFSLDPTTPDQNGLPTPRALRGPAAAPRFLFDYTTRSWGAFSTHPTGSRAGGFEFALQGSTDLNCFGPLPDGTLIQAFGLSNTGDGRAHRTIEATSNNTRPPKAFFRLTVQRLR